MNAGGLYLPIDTVVPAPGGAVIVSASLSRRDAAVERIKPGERDVAEMAAADPVGALIDKRLTGDGRDRELFCRARITARSAVAKIAEGVYRGLQLVMERDGTIARVALVDRPDAFAKRAGRVPAPPLPLTFGEPEMSSMSMLEIVSMIQRADPQRRRHITDTLLADYRARHGQAATDAAIGELVRKSAPPVRRSVLINQEEVALIRREERDRAEHRARMAKAAGREDNETACLDIFEKALRRLILPAFAFGHRE